MERTGEVQVRHPACPFCKEAVEPSMDKAACEGCMAWQHAACWTEHGSCAACGRTRDGRVARPKPAGACVTDDCRERPLPGRYLGTSGRCPAHTVGVVLTIVAVLGPLPFLAAVPVHDGLHKAPAAVLGALGLWSLGLLIPLLRVWFDASDPRRRR